MATPSDTLIPVGRSAIAARTGGPVLLVKPTALPSVVAKELTRLAPKRIVILGGEEYRDASLVLRIQAFE